MADIIERLEYGVKSNVSQQNPGLDTSTVGQFLRKMLGPSDKARYEADIISGHVPANLPYPEQKPLPPLPTTERIPSLGPDQYVPDTVIEETRSYLQAHDVQTRGAQSHSYLSTVDEWRLQQGRSDPMIAGPSPDQLEEAECFATLVQQPFEWHHLADDLCVDPNLNVGYGSG